MPINHLRALYTLKLLGDWEDVRLRETGKATGLFEGWLKTTLLPSINGDEKLGVQQGDILDVFYNDAIQRAGEYNRRLDAEVHVVAPVHLVTGAGGSTPGGSPRAE